MKTTIKKIKGKARIQSQKVIPNGLFSRVLKDRNKESEKLNKLDGSKAKERVLTHSRSVGRRRRRRVRTFQSILPRQPPEVDKSRFVSMKFILDCLRGFYERGFDYQQFYDIIDHIRKAFKS